MAELDFDQAAADAWSDRAQTLQEKTDMALKQVSAGLEMLAAQSKGDLIEEIKLTGAELLDNTAKMIHNMSEIVNAVKNIGARLLSWVTQQTSDNASARARSIDL